MKKKVFYHIGRLNEKEQLKFDIRDSLSRSAKERIKLGFIPMELPKIKDSPYRIFNNTKNTAHGQANICLNGLVITS